MSDFLTVEKIFIQNSKSSNKIKDIIQLAKANKAKIEFVDKVFFLKKFKNYNHQGVAAEVSKYKYYSLDELIYKKEVFLLILDSIQDQQNFGNIIRTAAFFGVTGIIIPKDRSVRVTDTTAKISAGAIFHIPIIKEVNLSNVLLKLKKENFFIISTSPEGKDSLLNIQLNSKVALIIGNEEKGVRKGLLQKSDYILKISGKGKIASLNASTSAAIFLYEISRIINANKG